MTEFVPFPKIARLNRGCVITEKIDGTNSSVTVPEDDGPILVGSRNRFITPEDDNFGFARYVAEHEDTFRQLGPGRHFGEWWGAGIGRRYGLDHKRFSLFNTNRWNATTAPEGLFVVPVLYEGLFNSWDIWKAMDDIQFGGSQAADFKQPEGIVVWHEAARCYFKATLDKDDEYKGQQ